MRHGVNDSFEKNEKKEEISNFVICLNFVFLIKYCVRFLISPEKKILFKKNVFYGICTESIQLKFGVKNILLNFGLYNRDK